MVKKIFTILTIVTTTLLLSPGVALAVGNGSISSNSPQTYSAMTATYTHDTLQGSLDSTALVIWNSDGSALSQYWIASSTSNTLGNYFYSNGTTPLTNGNYTLPAGTYKMAAISLLHTCCTNAQMESLWNNEANTNTNSSGYYYTTSITINAPAASTPTKMQVIWFDQD